MSIDKGKISNLQLVFLLIAMIQGSLFTGTYIMDLAKQDSWLCILSGFLLITPFAIIYALLAKRFIGMNLIKINDIVYGTYLGKVISLLYIFYFLMILSFNIRSFGDYYVTYLMPDSPLIFYIVVFTSGCAYSVYNGIEVLARICHFIVVFVFFIMIGSLFMLISKMDFTNLLPIFEISLKNFLISTHIIAVIPLGEVFVFLTFASTLNDTKQIVKNVFIGLMTATIGFVIATIRDTIILGGTQVIVGYPSYQTFRLINFGNIFTRMDILIGIGLTGAVFIKTSIFYYAVVSSLAEILKLKIYLPLILPIGAIAIIIAITDWRSSAEAISMASTIAPIFITPFILIFPLITFVLAKFRNLP
jgi:spore germination protein (amino acid permease)